MLANLLERPSLREAECEMMFRSSCSAVGLASILLLFSVTDLPACACCSDPGEYTLRTDDLGEYQLSQIQDIAFAPTAKLFLTDADEEENARGLSDVAPSYQVSSVIEPKSWRLTFKAKGKTGVLTLPFPPTMTDFAADIHDGKKSGGNGPLLYKEWRFEGSATGDGIFQEGFASPARYTLILQGRATVATTARTSNIGGWRSPEKRPATSFLENSSLDRVKNFSWLADPPNPPKSRQARGNIGQD